MTPTPDTKGTQPEQLVRAAISNAYYDARNAGETMETAADNAAAAVMEVFATALSECRAWKSAAIEVGGRALYGEDFGNGAEAADAMAAFERKVDAALAAQPPSKASEDTP